MEELTKLAIEYSTSYPEFFYLPKNKVLKSGKEGEYIVKSDLQKTIAKESFIKGFQAANNLINDTNRRND